MKGKTVAVDSQGERGGGGVSTIYMYMYILGSSFMVDQVMSSATGDVCGSKDGMRSTTIV